MFKKYFKTGEVIIRYGDMGHEYYVLNYGTCKVTVYNKGTKPNDPQLETKINFVKTMKSYPDQIPSEPMIGFGEIALLYNDKRTATVTALTNCEAWVLSGDVFKHIIAAHTIQRRNISLEYLDKVQLFKNLETYQKVKLIDGLKRVSFTDKEFIFHKGDSGDLFYIIEQGKVECGTEEDDGDFKLIRELG